MSAFFFVVAIMGCADGGPESGGACIDARLLPVRYATVAQCRAALPAAIADNTDVPFPTIAADCRPLGMRMAKAEGSTRGG